VRRNGPLPFAIASTIISQAAEGLHYAHRRGLVHRDVKPGNLLVTPDGRTKITDLGLAWFLMEELEGGKHAGKTGSLVGTADYLAPETIRQPHKILPVSDVYSLGCTLYYAVTGKVPFPGGNTADKVRRHLDETPLNPLHFNPDLPEGFCDAIAAMMDKNPDTRTPTAAAVVELLRPWRDETATRNLAEANPGSSGIFVRGGAPAPHVSPALDETASFVLDDIESLPGQLDSPSQISQRTVSVAAEMEDTVAGVQAPRRLQTVALPPLAPPAAAKSSRWPVIAIAVMLIATAAVAAVAWWVGLF
jgi:serine/threonine protein kinase